MRSTRTFFQEVPVACTATGSECCSLSLPTAPVRLQVEAVTVCLMNAYVNGVHERQIRDVLSKEMPHVPVSISSEVLPEMYEYERALTTVRPSPSPVVAYETSSQRLRCWDA